jgi:hypothetical protein
LFLPTPFAIRTAILDAAIRIRGLEAGPGGFAWIKELSIAIRPPERVVVTNLFTKILKPSRKEEAEATMDRTIAFREYAYLEGTMSLAFTGAEKWLAELSILLAQINYFGKRGCFFQLLQLPQQAERLPDDFFPLDGVYVQESEVKGRMPEKYPLGIVQMMDDWGESLTFEKVNVYNDEKINLGKDRIRKGIVLPYRLIRSSKGFSYYVRSI